MTDADLGQATIVYESPDGDTVEETVDNEYVAYFQDHWILKTDEDQEGPDVVRRIPATRVFYVERNVEEFEEEVRTVRDQVQSVASDIGREVRTLRDRIESVAGGVQRDRSGGGEESAGEPEAQPIEIEVGDGARASEAGSGDVDAGNSTTEGSGGEGSGGEGPGNEGPGDEGSADEDVDRSV